MAEQCKQTMEPKGRFKVKFRCLKDEEHLGQHRYAPRSK